MSISESIIFKNSFVFLEIKELLICRLVSIKCKKIANEMIFYKLSTEEARASAGEVIRTEVIDNETLLTQRICEYIASYCVGEPSLFHCYFVNDRKAKCLLSLSDDRKEPSSLPLVEQCLYMGPMHLDNFQGRICSDHGRALYCRDFIPERLAYLKAKSGQVTVTCRVSIACSDKAVIERISDLCDETMRNREGSK